MLQKEINKLDALGVKRMLIEVQNDPSYSLKDAHITMARILDRQDAINKENATDDDHCNLDDIHI